MDLTRTGYRPNPETIQALKSLMAQKGSGARALLVTGEAGTGKTALAEAKDYRDIALMIQHGVSLADGLGAARAMYGSNFQPEESLKALGYFGDGDLGTLTLQEKKTLLLASHSVKSIPDIRIQSTSLCRRENHHPTLRP